MLGNFLENQDVERWASMSSDPVSLHNAMVFTFMSDGYVGSILPPSQKLSPCIRIPSSLPLFVVAFHCSLCAGLTVRSRCRIPIMYYGQEQGLTGSGDPVRFLQAIYIRK